MLERLKVRRKSVVAVYGYLLRRRLYYLWALAAAIASVAALYLGLPSKLPQLWSSSATVILVLLSVFSTGMTVYGIMRDLLSLHKTEHELSVVEPQRGSNPVAHLEMSHVYKKTGYVLETVNQRTILYSHEVNRLLREEDVQVEISDRPIRLTGMPRRLAAKLLIGKLRENKGIWNDEKVRLVSDLTPQRLQAKILVRLQKTDFFTNFCTNEQTGVVFKTEEGDIIYDGMSLVSQHGKLIDLEDSKCGNEIGISTLAITRDRKLIVLEQSATNVYSANSLAPSGSGGADWRDLTPTPNSLQEFVIRASEREFREECGLGRGNSFRDTSKIRSWFLGFARFVNRGGKPEFFCVTTYDGDSDDVKRVGIETVFVARHNKSSVGDGATGIDADVIRDWRLANETALSSSLWVNLIFLERFARENPTWAAKLA